MYKEHAIPANETLEKVDLKEFQPEPQAVEQKIYQSEKAGRYLRNTIDLLSLGLIGAGATGYWFWRKK